MLRFTFVRAQALWLWKLQKNWTEFSHPLRQKKSHPFTRFPCHIPSYPPTCLQLLRKQSSLPLLGDLLHYQDSSQSHRQGALAYLLSVMAPHVFQLHSLVPLVRNSCPSWCLPFKYLQVRGGKYGTKRMSARHTENGKCISGEYKMQLL